jgi:integrase
MIQKRQRRRRDGSTYSVFRVRWYERDGRERSRTFDTMGDARAFEGRVRALKRAESLDRLDAGRETLADFTAEWWGIYATPNLERATLKGYSSLWNVHLLPRLGHLRLRDITVRTVAGFRRDLEAAGVGRETVRKALALLQGILQRAVEWERLGANPARAVRKPPLKRDRAVVPLPPQTVEALRAHLLNAGGLRDATLVSVLAYAGLRPGEALALQWRHVRERTILVERALTGDGEFKGQKKRRPPRTVDLLAPLRQDLAAWKLRQGRPGPSALVFSNAVGDPWKEHDWRNWRRRGLRPRRESGRARTPAAVRPAPWLRLAADPRGPALDRTRT